MPTTNPRRLVTLDEAAAYASVTRRTIRRRISEGVITGYRLGPRTIRVDLDELDTAFRVIPAATPKDAA